MDTCAGTFCTANACMLISNHRSFLACKLDPSCLTEAILQLTLLYARQVLSKESEFDGEEQVRSSAEVRVKAVRTIDVQMRLDM